MKTLVIVSHPDLLESSSQQFFLNWAKGNTDITVHHLEDTYPDGNINVKKEQSLLVEHDRILFQFPFYWYSSPPLLKYWQDIVLEDGFAYGVRGRALAGKEFGLIIMVGVKESEYQAGGTERFSINELTKPYQAMAYKTGLTYMKPFVIFQFLYMTEEEKMDTLIRYQQMLTMENDGSLATKEQWMIEQLEKMSEEAGNDNEILTYAIAHITENRDTMNELKLVLDGM
ncbi:NAD(P)H-dependent oxidoreductase [Virgibacillus dakarensis]|uniref:NAD(P)H-dependent oxidoreductase n=1 Tax=Virgibacillus dakarensis TaxID=1917889 RepID=UPI000B434FB4|nr:NAD(P)H-dependent oxidoreductase [Virgibacillus dakarensis]